MGNPWRKLVTIFSLTLIKTFLVIVTNQNHLLASPPLQPRSGRVCVQDHVMLVPEINPGEPRIQKTFTGS